MNYDLIPIYANSLQLLANEKVLNSTVDKILQESHEGNDEPSKQLIRRYLEKNGGELGLPPKAADDDVVLLYDSIFADVETKKQSASESEKDDYKLLLKEILGKFAEQLEIKPVFHDIDNWRVSKSRQHFHFSIFSNLRFNII